MKIRSLELRDFRKFVGSVRVDGIGDGLNVIVGPNEYGKSTLLAAINGVIFEKATSQNETVKGFRHFAAHDVPDVALAFELDGVDWTLRKRFAGQSGKTSLSGGNGHPLQGEAAEAELQRLLGFDRPKRDAEPGIWGTLWVQQGQSFGAANLDPCARRSLESCLETQVGIVTGGQRGQKIPEAVEAALSEIKSTRGPRGKFKGAVEQLAETKQQIEKLQAKRDQIFSEMDELARLRRERQRALADWDEAQHHQQLDELREHRTAAATKAEHIEAARTTAELATVRAKQARKTADDRQTLIDEIGSLEPRAKIAAERLERAERRKREVRDRIGELEQQLDRLRERERANHEDFRRLDRIRRALHIADEVRQHQDTLSTAAELPREINRLIKDIAANWATDENVSRVEDATSNLAAARTAVRAAATTVTFTLEPSATARIWLDGRPLDGPHAVVDAITKRTIAIDGIGKITIDPKIIDREAIVENVRSGKTELAAALELIGAKDLAASRRARAERHVLAGQLSARQREARELAPADKSRNLPAGLEAREARIAELQGKLKGETERLGLASLPTLAELEVQISAANGLSNQISRRIEEAVAALEGPKEALVEAEKAAKALGAELAGHRAALDDKRKRLEAERASSGDDDLEADAAKQERVAGAAREALAASERDQGETVAEIDARIRRLEAAGRQQADSANRLNIEIRGLETRIEVNEGDGVEEALYTALAEKERWQRTVTEYEEDVKVLELLRDTLRAAESEAKQLYLEPIAQRTAPYLKMLLPGAELRFDRNLGIDVIERNSGAEAFSYLSAGTQEQLAVLTRLAFAELLLDKGRAATIILDDALVFSDDDRIERMFDILTRAAEKIQIIVLTCRRRLFARLGASSLQILECSEAR